MYSAVQCGRAITLGSNTPQRSPDRRAALLRCCRRATFGTVSTHYFSSFDTINHCYTYHARIPSVFPADMLRFQPLKLPQKGILPSQDCMHELMEEVYSRPDSLPGTCLGRTSTIILEVYVEIISLFRQ